MTNAKLLLILGGAGVGFLFGGPVGALVGAGVGFAGGTLTSRGGDSYTDQNGIEWRIWEEMPNFWSASTGGYGGMSPQGYQSKAQAIENIEGNAAGRDPKTGAVL